MSLDTLLLVAIGLTEDKDNSTCDPLTKSDYIHIIWTTTAEIPGMCMYVRTYVRMYVCICVCMYVCMYV